MKNTSYKGVLLVFLSAILYGSYGIWSVLLGEDFGVFFQGYVRAAMVFLVLIPLCYFSNSWLKIEKENYKYFLLVALFASCTQVPLYYAYQNAGMGITSLVLFSFALFTSFIFGRLFLGEKITASKWIALIIGCLGLVLVFYNSLGDYSLLALFMAGLGGFAVGGQTAASKLIPKKFSAIQTSTFTWTSGLLVCLPMSLLLGEKQIIPTFDIHWGSMVIFAIAGLFAFYFVIEGFKKVDASIGGLIGLLEVVFGVAFGVLVFGEALTTNIILGSVLILIAATLPHVKMFQLHKNND